MFLKCKLYLIQSKSGRMQQNRELVGILDKRFLPGDSKAPFIESLKASKHEHVAVSLEDPGNIPSPEAAPNLI